MKQIIAIILIALNFSMPAAQIRDNEGYFRLMGEADKLIEENNWEEAESKLLEALRTYPANPSNVLLMSNLGMVRYYAGRTDEAITTLTDAHYMAPASVTVLQNRARIYAETGDVDKALADYSAVIALDSTLVEPRFYRAIISIDKNRIDSARADIAKLRETAPEDRLTNLADATLHMSQQEYAEAIPLYTKIIGQEPKASYYSSRALCYLMTQQLGEASADISSGLEIDPTDGELYLYRAMLNKMRFRLNDARDDASRAVMLGISRSVADAIIN